MEELAQLLMQRQISISSVESFTVGGFAKAIGSISAIMIMMRIIYEKQVFEFLKIDKVLNKQ